jgi:predicted ATPase
MKLVTFSVTNFRSITKAYKTPISDISILIGKNNEGKSNLLKALNIVMHALRNYAQIKGDRARFMSSYRNNDSNFYVWQRDFPISLQDRKSNTDSVFRLEFELTGEEIEAFKNEIKSNLNGTLTIEIKIGKNTDYAVSVIKKGRGSKALNLKSKKIAEYIANRIYFNYIPAIRTDQQAMEVVDRVMSSELAKLEGNKEYEKALSTIKHLQEPILDALSKKIKTSLCELLPNIKEVTIEMQENKRRMALRQQFDIQVDDGNKTSLEFKGDGVKSLAAMALLKDMSIEKGRVSLVAIEEPESHLHPGAIHILRETIYSLTNINQVILSTHNPLFVDRNNLSSNIIVESGKVTSAKSIMEIRYTIGVRASDNLKNANVVLVVEGEEDVFALNSLIPVMSEKLKKALNSHIFIIEKIGGAGNLSYKLSLLKNALCIFHVLLDNDEAGRNAHTKALNSGELNIRDSTFINCMGMVNSEFEDTLNVDIYRIKVENEYGITLNVAEFRNNKKWSDRMKLVFQTQGKPWNDKIEAQVKYTVASCVALNPKNALNEHKKSSILAMISSLERLVEM